MTRFFYQYLRSFCVCLGIWIYCQESRMCMYVTQFLTARWHGFAATPNTMQRVPAYPPTNILQPLFFFLPETARSYFWATLLSTSYLSSHTLSSLKYATLDSWLIWCLLSTHSRPLLHASHSHADLDLRSGFVEVHCFRLIGGGSEKNARESGKKSLKIHKKARKSGKRKAWRYIERHWNMDRRENGK